MLSAFIDTNVILRHLLADHPQQSSKSTEYFARIERGEISACISDTVVFEAVFTLERSYGQPKEKIRNALIPLIELSGIILKGKKYYREIFNLYVDLNLPFADAFHAVLARRLKIRAIVSYDKHFDGIPRIKRIEP